MKIEFIEGALVCVILFFQLRLFIKTRAQIGRYRDALPPVISLKISKFRVAAPEQAGSEQAPSTDTATTALNIIECELGGSGLFRKVLLSLNTYLIRNQGASPDFHLVKDIVERNVGALEEDINLTISLPLYLGLMGTMVGIVIGLFNIPDLGLVLDAAAKDTQLSTGIGLLIGGVKVAMIASFAGLLLTIISSGWLFKGSRTLVEARKNDFYTFIQTELLPVLNQSMGSTLVSLQRNLQLFNQDLTVNLDRLSGIFNTNYEVIASQERVLSKLEQIDMSQLAKFNITVLRELQKSTAEFEQFNSYLHSLNTFVDSSATLTGKANELLARTGNFETIAENLETKLDQSQALLEFLGRHFQELEKHKQFVNGAVADVGHEISGTFQELRQHIQNSTDHVRQFTVDEIDALRTALTESRTNLGNLAYLEDLNKGVNQFKTDATLQSGRIGQLLTDLQTTMARSILVLEQIHKDSLSYKVKHLFTKR